MGKSTSSAQPHQTGSVALPEGFSVTWDTDTAHLDSGKVVVGGVPRRLIRLSRHGRRIIEGMGRNRIEPVPDSVLNRLIRPLLDAGILHPLPGTAQLRASQVTVVIPVHNREKALVRLLPALTGVARVVVVDDGSIDGTGEVARSFGAHVIRRDVAGGPAAARNAGLEVVATEVVAFIDSDIRLEPGWLEPILAHLNDPSVAVAAPRIIGDVADRTDPLARYEVSRSPQDLGPHPSYVRPGNRASFLPAAVLVARTDRIKDAGGFAEELIVGEDVDLVWRLDRAGWRVRYEPLSITYHDARPSFRRFLRRRVDYGTSAAALHLRHPGKVAPIAVSPWSAAVWGTVLAGRVPLAGALAGISTMRLAASLEGKVDEHWRAARLIALSGHAGAASVLASAVSRTWLPLALLAMIRRRSRVAIAGFLLVPPLAKWLQERPPLDPMTYSFLYLADDAAYCVGVWVGCLQHRTVGPLIPRLYRGRSLFPDG